MKKVISKEYAAIRHVNMNRHKAAVLKVNRWLWIASEKHGFPLYKVHTHRKFYRGKYKCVYLQNQQSGEVVMDGASVLSTVFRYRASVRTYRGVEPTLIFDCDKLAI